MPSPAKHLETSRDLCLFVMPRKSSRRDDGWYDQLQEALLELLTCRDTGDFEQDPRRRPWNWWECAEGDCGLDERRHLERASEVATSEWSQFDVVDEAPPLLVPVAQRRPKLSAQEGSDARLQLCKPSPAPKLPNPPAVPAKSEKASASPQFGPRVDHGAQPVAGPEIFKMGPKRMGPAMLCPAVPAKLGDHPAPSFQVGMSFMEPLSGLSTASSCATRKTQGDMVLQVLLQGDRWVPVRFHRTDDLERRANDFLEEHKLSSLVKAGLLRQLKQMVTMRQLSASVDVVDLL